MNVAELEKLIDAFQEPLLKHAFFITGSMQDAEDIIQETFVKFYYQSATLNEASKTKAYLYRMVHNAGIDCIRKKKQNQVVTLKLLLTFPMKN